MPANDPSGPPCPRYGVHSRILDDKTASRPRHGLAASDLSVGSSKVLDFDAASLTKASGACTCTCVLIDRERKRYGPRYFQIEAQATACQIDFRTRQPKRTAIVFLLALPRQVAARCGKSEFNGHSNSLVEFERRH
ncbi:hypothetical protein AGROH133_15096 (plasmid) [Agrobacterium tumefaciens]|nr:hypothetical protein AGROH133_15096 [Agrobacterium tumefaciens]